MDLLLQQGAQTACLYPRDIGNIYQTLCDQIPGYASPNFHRSEIENLAKVVNINFLMPVTKTCTIQTSVCLPSFLGQIYVPPLGRSLAESISDESAFRDV